MRILGALTLALSLFALCCSQWLLGGMLAFAATEMIDLADDLADEEACEALTDD